jgi:hypothetical protein
MALDVGICTAGRAGLRRRILSCPVCECHTETLVDYPTSPFSWSNGQILPGGSPATGATVPSATTAPCETKPPAARPRHR